MKNKKQKKKFPLSPRRQPNLTGASRPVPLGASRPRRSLETPMNAQLLQSCPSPALRAQGLQIRAASIRPSRADARRSSASFRRLSAGEVSRSVRPPIIQTRPSPSQSTTAAAHHSRPRGSPRWANLDSYGAGRQTRPLEQRAHRGAKSRREFPLRRAPLASRGQCGRDAAARLCARRYPITHTQPPEMEYVALARETPAARGATGISPQRNAGVRAFRITYAGVLAAEVAA